MSDGRCQHKGLYVVLRSTSLHRSPPLQLMQPCTLAPRGTPSFGYTAQDECPHHSGCLRCCYRAQVPINWVLQHQVLPAPFFFMDGALRYRSQISRYFSTLVNSSIISEHWHECCNCKRISPQGKREISSHLSGVPYKKDENTTKKKVLLAACYHSITIGISESWF